MSQQRAIEEVVIQPRLGQQAFQRTRRLGRLAKSQPLGTASLVVLLLAAFMGIFAELAATHDPLDINPRERLASASAQHWLGTDQFGRDTYSRIVHGTRVSFIVAFFSIGIGTTAGYLLGIVSGYLGGKVDDVLQRVIDAMLAFPAILLALMLVSVLGIGLDKVVFAISFTFAPRAARVSRGVVLSVKENVYIDAARVIGATNMRIMVRHVLPNSMAPSLILASVGLGGAILTEAALSYLGLGVPEPHPSWGRMLSGGAQMFAVTQPWMVISPGAAIMLLVLAFNLLGDSVRDVLDPKLRGR